MIKKLIAGKMENKYTPRPPAILISIDTESYVGVLFSSHLRCLRRIVQNENKIR